MGKFTNAIAKNIERLRKEQRLSLQDLADRAGTSKAYMWQIENGRVSNIGIELAVNIAGALGVSLQYLAGLPDGSMPNLHPTAIRIAIEVDCALKEQDVD